MKRRVVYDCSACGRDNKGTETDWWLIKTLCDQLPMIQIWAFEETTARSLAEQENTWAACGEECLKKLTSVATDVLIAQLAARRLKGSDINTGVNTGVNEAIKALKLAQEQAKKNTQSLKLSEWPTIT